MAEETATATEETKEETKTEEAGKEETTNGQQTAATKTDADIEAIVAQADKPDAVRNALTSERKAAKEARERADELETKVKGFEDRDKSDQEKLEERATTAETKATKAEGKLLRYEVAVEKKLPLELADRLQGETKNQLEKDADRLLELVKRPDKPQGSADGGEGEGGEGRSFNDELRRK